MIARHVGGCEDNEFVLKIYDLKGSTINRETLTNNPLAIEKKHILKDLDFEKLEKQFFI